MKRKTEYIPRTHDGEIIENPPFKLYKIEGLDHIEKRVTAGTKSTGRIYLPKNWVGGRVAAILIENPFLYMEDEL